MTVKKIVKFMHQKKLILFFLIYVQKNMQKKFIQNYINYFKKNGFITVSFEHPNINTSSNISINPYMFKNKIVRKRGKVKLSGHKYFIFSKKISNYLKKRKKIRKDPSNILISLGGTDPKNIAQKLIKLILSLKLNIKLKVLMAFNTKVKHFFKKNKNIKFLSYQDDILKHLNWSDIAIINEGNIKFEAAIMGTPSIMINTIEKDNSKLINDFLKFKTSKYIPFQKLNLNFINNFHKYFTNKNERNFHSSNGRKYFNLKASEKLLKHYRTLDEL